MRLYKHEAKNGYKLIAAILRENAFLAASDTSSDL